jgi:Domain of unknown function (DUF1707)
MRIGDTERENALKALGEHMSVGRLDIDEYGDRSAKVTTARTRGELLAVFADLPDPKPVLDAPPPAATTVPATVQEAPVPATKSGFRGIPSEVAGPIIGLAWVGAIFIGPAVHVDWLFGVAIAVSIVMGSLTHRGKSSGHRQAHEDRRERHREMREEMRQRRRELRRGDR